MFHGPVRGAVGGFAEVAGPDKLVLVPAAILMLVLGVYPQLLAGLINPLITAWAASLP